MTVRCDHGALIDLEEKALADGSESWTITGYASIFNNTDLGNDAVVPGAFQKSLKQHGMPLLLFNHKMEDAPIGTVTDAAEDKRGLWFKAELPKDDDFVRGRIVPQLKKRGLRGTSIGYKATDKEIRKADGVRLLKTIRLFEISIVNMPMNPLAGVENIKGFVPFQDLFIAKDCKTWDAAAALKRLKSKFGDDEDLRRAFLYADDEKGADEWDARLLIADVDEKGRLYANPIALYKAVASLAGARGGVELSEGADEAVKVHLERYYSRLNLESPFKSLSVEEYESLEPGEREARLRGLGLSRKLAMQFSGQRDADRAAQRDAVSSEEAKQALLNTSLINSMAELVSAIKQTSKDLQTK
jgi:HK97 family phage prohead protease